MNIRSTIPTRTPHALFRYGASYDQCVSDLKRETPIMGATTCPVPLRYHCRSNPGCEIGILS